MLICVVFIDSGRDSFPAAIMGDQDSVPPFGRECAGCGRGIAFRWHVCLVLLPPRCLEDHLAVIRIVLRAPRVQQLAEATDFEARAAGALGDGTADAGFVSQGVTVKLV